MKKKGLIWLFMVLLVLVIGVPVIADELVPITKLGVAPWLGKIKDEKDLIAEIPKREDGFRRLYSV